MGKNLELDKTLTIKILEILMQDAKKALILK